MPLSERDFCGSQSFTPRSILKRAPRERPYRVAFTGITVFYFPRCQGFTSVPSRGGCTLGMAPCMTPRHSACCHFPLCEFTREQARVRREKLRQRLKEEKLEMLPWNPSASGVPEGEADLPLTVDAIRDASVEEDLTVAVAGGQLEEVNFPQHSARLCCRLRVCEGSTSRRSGNCRCCANPVRTVAVAAIGSVTLRPAAAAWRVSSVRWTTQGSPVAAVRRAVRTPTAVCRPISSTPSSACSWSRGPRALESWGLLPRAAPLNPGEQDMVSSFQRANPAASSELGDNNCSSDLTDIFLIRRY